ncbi:MAG: hypothetical protein ACLTEX_00800 [Eggerthella lenta]
MLASDPRRVHPRSDPRGALGQQEAADPNSITVMRIREKMRRPFKPRYLVTIWRVGYKLAETI